MSHPPKVRAWEILVRPSLWFRNYPVNKEFDDWLNDALDRDEPILISVDAPSDKVHEVQIAGLDVWFKNAPYADATTTQLVCVSPSRRTALRFRRAVAPLLKFQPPSIEEQA